MSSQPSKNPGVRSYIAHKLSKYIPSKPSKDSVRTLDSALALLYNCAAVFPPFQAAIQELTMCLGEMNLSPKHHAEFEELAASLEILSTSLSLHLKDSKSASMTEFVERMSIAVKEQTEIIASKQQNGAGRYMKQAHKDQDEIMNAYRQIESLFRLLQCDATLSVWNNVEEQLANTRIEALAPSKLAAYNSMLAVDVKRRACANNTRIQLLHEIKDWSHNPDAPNIYWMNGMAGTGKTTIAYTFSESLKARRTLGASFFCSRTYGECRDVGRIIPTIAYQLARYSRPFQVALTRILGSDPDIGTQTITHQFERLIKEPLASVKDAMPTGLVVVIDALDECSNTEGVRMILDVLFRMATSLPLKFFVTSRPEPSVHSRVLAQPDKTRLLSVLHEIESSLVQADIEIYLREELPSDKVSDTQLKQLAELAGNLFIYAATAIRYIRRAGGFIDQKRLGIVLSPAKGSGHQYAEVDRLYTSILADATENSDLDVDEKNQVQLVFWTAVCVREPVTIKTLAELIGSEPGDVETALGSLFSVLHVSEKAGTVSTLHASFPDYIFDQTRSERFHCIESDMNQILAEHCFDIMDRELRFNICGLESSFKYDDEVEGLTARVAEAISPTLSYVIGHWGDHLVRSSMADSLQTVLLRFLSTRLLFWIESLNLKGILGVGINTLLKLKSWLMAVSAAPDLVKSLDDCWLFLTRFAASSIAKSTPHMYISALTFCHHTSSVYKNYWPRTRGLLTLHGSAIEQSQTALLATWNMHSEPLSLAFSSDASRFAVGFSDGTVSILDAHTGVPVLGPLKDHTDWVTSIALSPDGSLLASCSSDRTVIVRDTYTGARKYDALHGHESWVTSVCFSPDGRNLVSGSTDRTTRIWDSHTGRAVPNSVTHHYHPVNYVTYSPDGKHIACGLESDECPMIVYSVSTGQPIPGGFDAHQSSVRSVTFSPDGKRLVTGHTSGDICVWIVRGGVLTYGPLKAHKDSMTLVRFSPTGNSLVTASNDGSVYVWDAHNHYADPCLLGTHQDWACSVTFSPDGTRILSCSLDRTVKVWNALHSISSDNAPWKTPTKAVYSVTFSPDGSRIAAASGDHAIYIFSAHDATPALDPLVAHTDAIKSVTFSADGRYIASGGEDCAVCLWDGTSGKLLSGPLRVHTARVWSVSISPDSTRLISGSVDGTIRMWDVGDSTLTPSDLVAAHDEKVYSASFSPDGKRIVTGCADGKIRMWSSRTLTLVLDPFGSQSHTDYIRSVVFSPDGRLVASGSDDCTICVFDSHTGHLILGPLQGHTNWVRSVVFSPDGTHILSGSEDRTVRVWRVKDGAPACEPLLGHQGEVVSVGYSPDGASIVSGSWDSTVRVWKAPRGHDESGPSRSNPAALGNRKPHGAILSGLKVLDDGRVENGNSQRLLLVPLDMVKLFPTPETEYTIGSGGILRADYSAPPLLGDDWHRCFVG